MPTAGEGGKGGRGRGLGLDGRDGGREGGREGKREGGRGPGGFVGLTEVVVTATGSDGADDRVLVGQDGFVDDPCGRAGGRAGGREGSRKTEGRWRVWADEPLES
jgi:hypothetical protein